MTDAALVLRARGGDELAFRRLTDRYEGLRVAVANEYFVPGGDINDLKQEALIGLYKAVRDYRPDRGGGVFSAFAALCVRRQVITAVKTATRGKHGPLNAAISMEFPVGSDDGDLTLGDVLPSSVPDPVEILDRREQVHQIQHVLHRDLSELEREAVLGAANGLSYGEIAADFAGASHKTVDNALQRGRRKLTLAADRPAPGAAPPPRRRRRPSHSTTPRVIPLRPRIQSTTPTHQEESMSIVESIDAEIKGVEEELEALEAQLGPKRNHLEGLQQLREQAENLQKSEGGGLPETATPPAPKAKPTPKPAAKPKRQVSVVDPDAPFHEQVFAHVQQHPGCSGLDIATAFGIADGNGQSKVSYALKNLGSRVVSEKVGRGKAWKVADRPKPAPTREGRAASAPAKKSEETRPAPAPEPKVAPAPPAAPAVKKPEPKPASAKAEARKALLDRISQAILELVADSEPVTAEEIDTMILEQLEDVERVDVERARANLAGAGTHHQGQRKLERRPEGYRLINSTQTAEPITRAEREAVACLGSGRTPAEVAANCDQIRGTFAAIQILEGLVRRGVIRKRSGEGPAVYEAITEPAAA